MLGPLPTLTLSESVSNALRLARVEQVPGQSLQTARLLDAIARADVLGNWQYLWLRSGYPTSEQLAVQLDPESTSEKFRAVWQDIDVSDTLALALRLLARICESYPTDFMQPGHVVVALLAFPHSGAVRALLSQGGTSHAELLDLAQTELLGELLEGLDAMIRSSVPTPLGADSGELGVDVAAERRPETPTSIRSIGDRQQLEARIERQRMMVERLIASARQALILSDTSRAEDNSIRAQRYEEAAQAYATELVKAEVVLDELTGQREYFDEDAALPDELLEPNARGPKPDPTSSPHAVAPPDLSATQSDTGVAINSYAAFVSYSHAADSDLAEALQRDLQGFAKPWFRLRALRVFLDRASMTANPGLWSSVTAALDSSSFLILMACPESAASEWVQREVEYWLRHKGPQKLLIAMTAGRIVWDWSTSDFDWTQTTAIPRLLQGVYREDPRWIDLSWIYSGREISLDDERYRDCVADLAVPLHGKEKDDLIGQHLSAAADLIEQREAARKQSSVARSRQLANQAILLSSSSPRLATLLAVAAFEVRDTAEARGCLLRQLRRLGHIDLFCTSAGGYSSAIRRTNERIVVATSSSGRVEIRDLQNRENVWQVALDETNHFYLSSDGSRLALPTTNGIDVVDVERGALLAHLTGGHPPVTFSPDNSVLATASRSTRTAENTPVLLWDIASNSVMDALPPAVGNQPLAFSSDGRTLALNPGLHVDVSDMILWDVVGKRVSTTFQKSHTRGILSVCFSPDGRTIATGGHDARIILWDCDRGSPRIDINAKGDVNSLDFSPDGAVVVSGDSGKTVSLWEVESGDQVGLFEGHTSAVVSVRFSIDGMRIASVDEDGTAILWSVKERDRLVVGALADARMPLSFHRNSDRICLQDSNESTLTLRGIDGSIEKVLPRGVLAPDWSVLYISSRPDRSARHGLLRSQEPHVVVLPDEATPIAVSPDGRSVVVSAIGTPNLQLWSADSARYSTVLPAEWSPSVAYSPDGEMIAIGQINSVLLVDAVSGSQIARKPGYNPGGVVRCIAFSRDGRWLAWGTHDAPQTAMGNAGLDVILWDLERDVEVARFMGHNYEPYGLSFSPDSTLLASASEGEVILWSVEQLAPLETFPGEGGSVAFSPDGRLLATGRADNSVVFREVDAQSWRTRLCSITNSNLSEQEWARFISGAPFEKLCE